MSKEKLDYIILSKSRSTLNIYIIDRLYYKLHYIRAGIN